MTEQESIELARAYVALSNAHRVDLIAPMFAQGAVYRSSAVGEFTGRAAIAEMMRDFFTRYENACWLCEDYRCTGTRVSFAFSLQAKDSRGGDQLQRGGVETIEFDADGLIATLVVRTD